MDNQGASRVVVHFDGPLVIGTIPKIYGRILEALNSHQSVTVRVDDAADVDVTFLQLLVSASKTARALGRDFSVSAPEDSALFSKLKNAGNLHGEVAIGGDAS